MDNKSFMTPGQAKAKFIGSLKNKAVSVDREGLDLFNMEENVPYLMRLEKLYDYTTKEGKTELVADVTEVTTGESGQVWLEKTRLKNIFNDWDERTKAAEKGHVTLLEITDLGLQDAPEVKGGVARGYKRAFVTVKESDLNSLT